MYLFCFVVLNVHTLGSRNNNAIQANVRVSNLGTHSVGFDREEVHSQWFKALLAFSGNVMKQRLLPSGLKDHTLE